MSHRKVPVHSIVRKEEEEEEEVRVKVKEGVMQYDRKMKGRRRGGGGRKGRVKIEERKRAKE